MAELFENIWVNREPRWPLVSKLLVGSLIFHSSILAAVVYVPAVQNALELAQAFSNAGYVDEDYKRTRIEDRAVMLSLKDGVFTYPPGYFNSPLTSQAEGMPSPTPTPPEAKIISEFKEEKEKKPKPTPTVVAKVTPSPSPSPSAEDKTAELLAQAKDKESADKALDQIAAEGNVERPDETKINKKPLKDWVKRSDKLRLEGKLDLNKMVEIVIEADRGPDGVLKNVAVVKKQGDPELINVATDLAAAISDSKVLYFLTDSKHLRITLRLDSANVTATVESDVGSEELAKSQERTYGGLLVAGQMFKHGKDEETIYKAAKIKAEGKQVIVNFTMPRDTATGILKKYTDQPVPMT